MIIEEITSQDFLEGLTKTQTVFEVTHQIETGEVFRVDVTVATQDLEIETDGGRHTVNRGGYSPASSFSHLDGAGYRAVYDLGDLDNSRFTIATGQSGNFLSPHYRDFLHRWRDADAPKDQRRAEFVRERRDPLHREIIDFD